MGRGATFYFTLNAKEARRYPVITLSHCYNTNREAASPPVDGMFVALLEATPDAMVCIAADGWIALVNA